MASDPDAALMVAFQGGDERAFRSLFEKYARPMVSFCHHFVRDQARAEELAQDVFLKVHRNAARYQPTARFKTFLYRIASNHCLNELRRGEYAGRRAVQDGGEGALEPVDPDALPGVAATPEEDAAGRALGRAVDLLLARLPEKQRAAFVLGRLEGMPYEEVAAVLETTVPAVKSLVHRATVAAAAALAPYTSAEEVAP
ncbi:RNA polymerase sigma factor [Anaeromyxobacter diazotrophicus]|uniref:RNA polymerase sigma24 factor n=1 Tax=Anaeromyxobacter diazotrophicus TaxID=2590199 RepID=A0A7I9VLX6_9BACT|nr:RNA polymerase sigma factor [Anaeromyxobacter diazotrophicus]GEJ57405.1 RNA polymerase sigma24 factor [Anaeromyxobacter diazotrophicus]